MNLPGFTNHNLDEVVFEHRNKMYGAYALRKSYSSHLIKASLFAILFFLLLYSVSWLASLFKPAIIRSDADKLIPFEPMKGFEIVIEPQAAPAPPKTSLQPITHPQSEQMTIVRDNDVNNKPQQPTPATQTNTNPFGATEGPSNVTVAGTGTVSAGTNVVPLESENTVQTFVEQMPDFPGGAKAMRDFLASQLQYPQSALQLSVEGKVLVSFIVEPDGTITNIQVERSKGYGLDEEAVRVVKLMPKWSCGLQNGKKVRVKLVLPIQFSLQ